MQTATACDIQWRANREERTQRSGINSTAAGALRKTPWLAHSHLLTVADKGRGTLPLLRTYLRCILTPAPFLPLLTRFPIYDPLSPHRSAVRPFEYNPRPLSISHCHISHPTLSLLTSHFYFIPFSSLADLSFFRALHT